MKKNNRRHDHAIFLRLTKHEYDFARQCAHSEGLAVQEFLRQLIRYGKLPAYDLKKALTAR